jgi:hypothetical protein
VNLPDDQGGRVRCYRNTLRNEANRLLARASDYVVSGECELATSPTDVVFKRVATQWLANELPDYTLREICRILHEHVEGGGKIHEVVETRPEYLHWRFHYDLRIRISGRHVYFETTLVFEDAEDEDDFRI